MTQYSTDPLSACCGTPTACTQAHLYCFNRVTKEADVSAMNAFEQKAFEALSTLTASLPPVQKAINEATQGSIEYGDCMAVEEPRVQKPTSNELELRQRAAAGEFRPEKDEIKRPDHYARFAIEPCTFIMLNELPYWTGNVVKYVTRAPHKHADERIDIRKAIRYCEMRIEELDRVAAGTDGDVIRRPL